MIKNRSAKVVLSWGRIPAEKCADWIGNMQNFKLEDDTFMYKRPYYAGVQVKDDGS